MAIPKTLTITYEGDLEPGRYLVDTWAYTISSLEDVPIDAAENFANAVFEVEKEPAIIADPGVSPADGTTVEGVQAFTFGFKSATSSLEELELDIYLGENTGENRDYAGHLGINLPAGSEAVASWVEQVVAGYGELDSKFHGLLAAAGYVVDAGDEANKQALKENIFYTAGDDGTGTWTIKLDTAVLGEEKVEFLVTVRDDAGAQWGNNNYVAYPDDVKAFLYNVTLPEPAIIADPGVSPADGATVEGVQAFTFGFKSATGNLEELELDIYLGDNTGANRDYAEHLGINLPAGSEAVEAWVDQVVAYDELDEKYHAILAAAGYKAEAGDDDNKQALKENIFYTGDEKAGTWTIKLDTAVLDVEAIEFLVAVRDDQGAQWGNNNYVAYPDDVKAFLYNVTLPEPAITMTAGEPTIEDGKVTLAVTTKNTGADYENARYGIKVNAAGVEGDTISVSYGDEGLTFNLTRVEGSDDFIGYFGPADGFTITKGWDVTTTFTVDFGTAASDRTVKVDAWVNQGAEPAEEDAVAKMEQLEITIPAAEPEEYHTYKFKIEDKADEYIVSDGLVDPTDADFAGMTPVKLSIVVDSEKDKAYGGNVRVAPVNADGLQLWAKDTAGKWHDINQVGWGPSEGFPIDTTLVTDVYVIATAAFDGTVTLELVDVTGDYGAVDNIIISQEVAVKAVVDEQAQALAAVNDYLTPANYNYAGAPEALEGHLAVLGLDVGEDSDYAALDKTDIGGKNRKTAVFYDLNQNKPDEGYDLATLTTYFNDMVATRLVTEESMDLVNNAQTIEDLEGISFVTMLLDAFDSVSYQTHSEAAG
jgi:hypothetical protein